MKIKKIFIMSLALLIISLFIAPENAKAVIIIPSPTPQPVFSPNMEIGFSFAGTEIFDGEEYNFPIGQTEETIFIYPNNIGGKIYTEIYKGELNNSKLFYSSQVDGSGILKTENIFNELGKYFVVIYKFSPCDLFCFIDVPVSNAINWFETGEDILAYKPPLPN